jgi:multidrug efflux pump subunit AcrA (membrane-fusion protein)
VTLFDREGEPLVSDAYISRVSPVIDAETGTFKAWVSSPTPLKRAKRRRAKCSAQTTSETSRASLLKPGLFVTAEVTLDEKPRALLLTREALMYRDGVPMVALVHGSRVKLTELKLGFTEADTVEVLSPLKEGDQVVSFGQRGLEDGALIKVTSR